MEVATHPQSDFELTLIRTSECSVCTPRKGGGQLHGHATLVSLTDLTARVSELADVPVTLGAMNIRVWSLEGPAKVSVCVCRWLDVRELHTGFTGLFSADLNIKDTQSAG